MGIMLKILITFLLAVALLIVGFAKKSKSLKIASLVAFAISIVLYLFVWNALGYM